jgi:hypothetical protein
MSHRRLADDAAGQNRLRWPAIPPLVVALLVYLGLAQVLGTILMVTWNPASPPPLEMDMLAGWSGMDMFLYCNAAWALLFVLEWILAAGMPPTARRTRRIYAVLAVLGLIVVQLESWALVRALAA